MKIYDKAIIKKIQKEYSEIFEELVWGGYAVPILKNKDIAKIMKCKLSTINYWYTSRGKSSKNIAHVMECLHFYKNQNDKGLYLSNKNN